MGEMKKRRKHSYKVHQSRKRTDSLKEKGQRQESGVGKQKHKNKLHWANATANLSALLLSPKLIKILVVSVRNKIK